MILRSVLISLSVGILTVLSAGTVRGIFLAGDAVRVSLPVVVFFQPQLSDHESQTAFNAIKSMDPGILSARYFSKEDASQEARLDPVLSRALMLLENNPFLAGAELHLSHAAWSAQANPMTRWTGVEGIQDVRWDAERRSAAVALNQTGHWLAWFLWAAISALILWSFRGFYAFCIVGLDWRGLSGHLFWGCLGGSIVAIAWLGIRSQLPAEALSYWSPHFPILPILNGGLVSIGLYTPATGEKDRRLA